VVRPTPFWHTLVALLGTEHNRRRCAPDIGHDLCREIVVQAVGPDTRELASIIAGVVLVLGAEDPPSAAIGRF
jgi:hypothetical protein